jgi:fructosamine-3-kinase
LPKGCRVVSTVRHGISLWANSGRIDVKLEDGSPKTYFIKVVSKEAGRQMMNGEFESMTAIYNVLPNFTPKPIAWGSYETVPDTHFFISEFREMSDELPDPQKFTAQLATLHQKSESPNGKFGFHITTFNGNLPQDNGWENSWEAYFAKSLRYALKLESAAQGPDPEIDRMTPIIFEKVIPRLLRPLESNGRSVKPSLIHGDLWYANTTTDAETDDCLVFDACCFYAHHECKVHQFSRTFQRPRRVR